jgi:antitoxin component of MazEF toxin-antitoxin module
MELVDRTNIIAVGKSLYVLVPSSIRKVTKLVKGDRMNVYKEGNRIIYEEENPK